MARTNPRCAIDTSAAAATSSTPRIRKTRSDMSFSFDRIRMTRQRSRVLAEAESHGGLLNMIEDEQTASGAYSPISGSSSVTAKGKAKVEIMPRGHDAHNGRDKRLDGFVDICPITDKDTALFPIMELPTEIRLEIYRACLTRPYNILLSKKEQPPCVLDEEERLGMDDDLVLQESGSGDGNTTSLVEESSSSSEDDESVVFLSRRTTRPSRRYALGGLGRAPVTTRAARPIRLTTSRSAPVTPSSDDQLPTRVGSQSSNSGVVFRTATSARSVRPKIQNPEPFRPQSEDPLIINILQASKEVYKEARSVLYSENIFTLHLDTAIPTLACLHQRSRSQIKHVELEIPTYNEILERFQETVRLSLRYCSGLKKLVIHMPFTLPGADGSGTTGNTTVYANGFDILRWLPQACDVALKGNICTEIETVVNKHLHLAKTLDKVSAHALQYTTEEYMCRRSLEAFKECDRLCMKAAVLPREARFVHPQP